MKNKIIIFFYVNPHLNELLFCFKTVLVLKHMNEIIKSHERDYLIVSVIYFTILNRMFQLCISVQ